MAAHGEIYFIPEHLSGRMFRYIAERFAAMVADELRLDLFDIRTSLARLEAPMSAQQDFQAAVSGLATQVQALAAQLQAAQVSHAQMQAQIDAAVEAKGKADDEAFLAATQSLQALSAQVGQNLATASNAVASVVSTTAGGDAASDRASGHDENNEGDRVDNSAGVASSDPVAATNG
jgi:hypothetical protein